MALQYDREYVPLLLSAGVALSWMLAGVRKHDGQRRMSGWKNHADAACDGGEDAQELGKAAGFQPQHHPQARRDDGDARLHARRYHDPRHVDAQYVEQLRDTSRIHHQAGCNQEGHCLRSLSQQG